VAVRSGTGDDVGLLVISGIDVSVGENREANSVFDPRVTRSVIRPTRIRSGTEANIQTHVEGGAEAA
jgi:hypothetical protein